MRTFLSLVLIVVTINITKAQNDVIKGVTCHEAFELIQLHLDDPNFVIIDLRPEKMYMDEHIQDAIYYDVFSKQFDKLDLLFPLFTPLNFLLLKFF